MKILVTGNLGYIGPAVTRLAKERGHTVVGLDVGYFRDCRVRGAPEVLVDRQIWRDIRDVCANDLDGIDAVIHLAGLSNDVLRELDPQLTHEINFSSTVRLGELAKAAGVRSFVFASSCAVYGAAGGSHAPLDEAAPLNPVTAYAEAKSRSEIGLRLLGDETFSPVILRYATAFGVGPRMRFDLVLSNLVGHAHATGLIRVASDGTPWRPLAHIEDIGAATVAALSAPQNKVRGQTFNIGRHDSNHRVRDIAAAARRAFPGSRLEITGAAGADPRSYRVNFDKALVDLPGFNPRWTLEMGVEEVARLLRDGGLGGEAFDARRFNRVKQLKYLSELGLTDSRLRATGKHWGE